MIHKSYMLHYISKDFSIGFGFPCITLVYLTRVSRPYIKIQLSVEIRVILRTFMNDLRTRYIDRVDSVTASYICSRKVRIAFGINSYSLFKHIHAIFQVFGEPKGLMLVELVVVQLLQVCWSCPGCTSPLGEPLYLGRDLENVHKHNSLYQLFTPRLADVVYLLELPLDTIDSKKQHETA